MANQQNKLQASLVNVRRDLCDTRIHAYMPTFVVWGRKPHPQEMVRTQDEHDGGVGDAMNS